MRKFFFTILFVALNWGSIIAQDIKSLPVVGVKVDTIVTSEIDNRINAIENQFPEDSLANKIFEQTIHTQLDTTATALRSTWLANRPKDNWFMSLTLGFADLQSEQSRYRPLMDRISPTYGFAVGKWFSPVWGARLNITGASLQGFTVWKKDRWGGGDWYIGVNYPNPNSNPNRTNNYVHAYEETGAKYIEEVFLNMDDPVSTKKGDGYTYDFSYMAGSLDFLLNLKNLCMPYNPRGLFNPIIYAGVGFAHTFKDGGRTAVNNIMEKIGLMLDFRLCDSWNVFLDGQMMFVPEIFDRRVGDNNTQDILSNLSIGVSYKFNFRHFIKADIYDQDPGKLIPLNEKINSLRKKPLYKED